MYENDGTILLCKSAANKYNRSGHNSNNQRKQASHEYICKRWNDATLQNAHEQVHNNYRWYTAAGNVK